MKIFVSIFLISLSLCSNAGTLTQEEALNFAKVLEKVFNIPYISAVLMQESTACKYKTGEGQHYGCMQVGIPAAIDVINKYCKSDNKYTKKFLTHQLKHNDVFNIVIGSLYLKMKVDEFNGDINRALIAYNKGSREAKRYKYPFIHPYVLLVKRYTTGEIEL